jgi:ubiquinone/menaquinone biosynthesis C-methylase UbiE
MQPAQELKERVRDHWDGEPCGVIHTDAPEGSSRFYDEIERRRDELEPFLPELADFAGARGLSVLEIGVGIGTDFIRFARAGARVTGVDLTEHAVELVRRRLELEGLDGEVVQADAEQLPFAAGTFDRVYSWGVLHHTPDTDGAVREAVRVLAPGGSITVMLYNRISWVAFGLWVRRALLRGRPWLSLRHVLANHLESPGTKGYTAAEVRSMFAGLDELHVDVVGTRYDRYLAGPLGRIAPGRLGWFIVIRGRRPA